MSQAADIATFAGTGLGLVGLGVSFYTLYRVGLVAEAQTAARRTTEELLSIDELEIDLLRVISRLSQSPDRDAVKLAGELGVKLGMIQGVRRTFRAELKKPEAQTISIQEGFFGQEFVKENVDQSHQVLEIITGRTKLAAGFYILDSIRRACERGVRVRILGLSPDAPDEILEDAKKTVSNPAPTDAGDYRQQICDNRDEILRAVESWPDHVRVNFEYCLNSSVPRISALRCDSSIRIGFLQLYTAAQEADLGRRPYLALDISSEIGKSLMNHFEVAWREGSVIFTDGKRVELQPVDVGSIESASPVVGTVVAPTQPVDAIALAVGDKGPHTNE